MPISHLDTTWCGEGLSAFSSFSKFQTFLFALSPRRIPCKTHNFTVVEEGQSIESEMFCQQEKFTTPPHLETNIFDHAQAATYEPSIFIAADGIIAISPRLNSLETASTIEPGHTPIACSRTLYFVAAAMEM